MAAAAVTDSRDWREEWFEFEDASYLNVSGQAPMPKVSLRAAQTALEWKKFPQNLPHAAFFEIPNHIRRSLATMIGAKPEEIALTTGASTGMAAVAYGVPWKREDEILTAKGEFPCHFSTWKPLEEREGVRLRVIAPRERFVTAQDVIANLTPATRLVSLSLVRFDDGSLLDAVSVSAACRANNTRLLLDVSQCCGALPLDVAQLGADFIACAGYKWLLGPFGTGFFWAKGSLIEQLRPGPFNWMALRGAENFTALALDDPKPVPGARRWDAAETSSYFNIAAMKESVDLVLRMGPENVARHNAKLIDLMFERLPKDSCVPASPLNPAQRGPYGCFRARTPENTAKMFEKLQKSKVYVSLREGNIRVSPHLFNTERDIDRLIAVVTAG